MTEIEMYAKYCYGKQMLEEATKELDSIKLLYEALKKAKECGVVSSSEYSERLLEISDLVDASHKKFEQSKRILRELTEES